jgi:hypothetical protein
VYYKLPVALHEAVLEGKGRLIVQEAKGRVARVLVYLPIDVARDSKFPFHAGPVTVRIEDHGLVVKQ